MARARNIKPSFFQNEYLAALSPHARLLFIGLWCIADRQGRLEDRPPKIKACLFPYENIDVEKLLNELTNSDDKFIIRYNVNGKLYIQIVNFLKHQSPHLKECASTIPAPDKHQTSTRQASDTDKIDYVESNIKSELNISTIPAPYQHHTSTSKESLIPLTLNPHTDSLKLITDSLNPISEISFKNFWTIYPKKIGKSTAERAFIKLAPDETLFTTIIDAVKKQTEWEQWKTDNGKYIPNASTWLNQKRWEDEAPQIKNNGHKQERVSNTMADLERDEKEREVKK